MSSTRRYIVFARGGRLSSEEVAEVRRLPGARIVEEIGERSVLADLPDDSIEPLRRLHPTWLITAEVRFPPPGPALPPDPLGSPSAED